MKKLRTILQESNAAKLIRAKVSRLKTKAAENQAVARVSLKTADEMIAKGASPHMNDRNFVVTTADHSKVKSFLTQGRRAARTAKRQMIRGELAAKKLGPKEVT